MKPELRFEEKKMRVADLGKESCVPDLLGELTVQNQLEFRLDEDDEIFEGYGRVPNAYPYRQYNRYTRALSEREIHTAVLENDYLIAVFLPEYGGRLWKLWDKVAGRDLLYTNDVIRFSNLAVRNAWFSGGVEWNLGVIGHTPFTADALYTAETKTESGDPVLRMYEYERIRKVTYQMDFWLEADSRFLNCRMRIVNESKDVVPMYWWSNMAVPEYEDGRVIVPAEQAYTNGEGEVYKVDIPMVNGVDVTDFCKIPRSVDYFFNIPEESPKYIAAVDSSGYGIIQRSTKRLRSRKLFSWGHNPASDHWQEFLTDQAGRYLEIQAGLGKTQYGCIPMAPHTAWEWMEQYGAIRLDQKELALPHTDRAKALTGHLIAEQIPEHMESRLKETGSWARKQAKLVYAGSGYGGMAEHSAGTEHLEFCVTQESLKKWQKFFETGELHCPKPSAMPDEMMIDSRNVGFLAENMEKNRKNWYAHYHLGIGYFVTGEYKKAEEELRCSSSLAENPWALHGLACTCMVQQRKKEAADHILAGMKMRRKDPSYLKEGFRILSRCEEDEQLCRFYESLDQEEQQVNRIRFYYIGALHHLGNNRKAYEILEADGGMELEDIREGEDSLAQLWRELYNSLYSAEKAIPHRYDFTAH